MIVYIENYNMLIINILCFIEKEAYLEQAIPLLQVCKFYEMSCKHL